MYRVLLVEDDSQIREVVGDYFKRRDKITLDLAEDGNAGLSKVLNEKYDLIVNLDDFFLIDGALSDVEVLQFGGYYGM